jgi:hypothetical protein
MSAAGALAEETKSPATEVAGRLNSTVVSSRCELTAPRSREAFHHQTL